MSYSSAVASVDCLTVCLWLQNVGCSVNNDFDETIHGATLEYDVVYAVILYRP